MEDLELLDLGESINVLWQDRTRILGIPIGLTAYRLCGDRLIVESGVLNIQEEQIMLYRVQDLQLRMALWQRPFHIGTICVYSTDKTTPIINLVNIKYPRKVKELIHRQVEDARLKRKVRLMEIMSTEHSQGAHLDLDEMDAHIDDQDLQDIQEEINELDGNPES